MSSITTVEMKWTEVNGHQATIIGTLDTEAHTESWAPNCSCGETFPTFKRSYFAQTEIRGHLAEYIEGVIVNG